jgi:hypothetical protein
VLARWTVAYGPQFGDSVKAISDRTISRGRLNLAVANAVLNFERDPFRYSSAFTDEEHRVIMSDDYAVGYHFCVFAVLDIAAFEVTIMWVDVVPVEDGADEDDDEQTPTTP